jgi:FtsP/CotA-like multicopper oxidase with cupredoxin domain
VNNPIENPRQVTSLHGGTRNWVLAVFALLLAALALIPETASAAGTPCPRPGIGSVVAPPPDLYSANGVLTVAFNYFTSVDEAGHTLFCFVTPDGQQSPTLHVNPGDTIKLTLTNMVPAAPPSAPSEIISEASTHCGSATMTITSVNMHFHGTNTSPRCHSDEVVHTLINSGKTFVYTVVIPTDEPPGLYWYHPHVHGLAEAAVQGGASGAIEVEGIANLQPAVSGLPERFLLVRDQLLTHYKKKSGGTPPAWDVSLNYVPILYPQYIPAVIKMHAGAKEFWRVVNASADTITDLQLVYDGVAQPLQLVALDGVPLNSQDGKRQGTIQTQPDIVLPPASRAEFIVTGPQASVASAVLRTRAINTGPLGDNDPERPLATIETTGSDGALPRTPASAGPANAQRFEGLASVTPNARRRLYFSENPSGKRLFVTVNGQHPTPFNAANPPAITTTQGSVEDWTIENHATEEHVFHIHQIHFLVLAVNGVPIPRNRQQFYDTYPVSFWSGSGPYPSIKVRMDFRGPVTGDFVYHCHILGHEDAGMMAIIRVLPKSSAGHFENGSAPAHHV